MAKPSEKTREKVENDNVVTGYQTRHPDQDSNGLKKKATQRRKEK